MSSAHNSTANKIKIEVRLSLNYYYTGKRDSVIAMLINKVN